LVATSLVRLDNFLISIGALITIALIVKSFKSDGPWAGSFSFALKLALTIIVFRVFIGIVIGVPVPGTNLFTLPVIPLPDWMAGIRLGGAVTWERVSSTILESLDIATIIVLFGAATSLTNPRALIRSFPPIFYELGMILIISSSLTPQLVGNLKRIRNAQQIRGVSGNRFLAWRQIAMPLLEDSLARSLDLAAAMDARGYGISRTRSKYRPQKFQVVDLAIISISILILAVSL
jgi:energy-coupling factor transport system permease protein